MQLFNQERKLRFMNEYPLARNYPEYIYTVFDRAGRYEREYNADICDMTADQLVRVLDNVGRLVAGYFGSLRSVLISYIDWCVVNAYCSKNVLLHTYSTEHERVRAGMVANAEHLKATLDVVYDSAETYTSQYIYRTVFWLAFIGFRQQVLTDLRAGDVDFDTMRIKHTERNSGTVWGNIPSEAVLDLRQACSLTSLTYDGGHYIKEFQRSDGDRLVRMQKDLELETDDDKMNYIIRSVRPAVSKAFKRARDRLNQTSGIPRWCSIDISYDNVLRSGVFCRHYERERAGLDVSLENIYMMRFGAGDRDKEEFARFRYSYQRSYAVWKEVYT